MSLSHLTRVDAGQLGLERAEFLTTAVGQPGVDLRQPARRPVQARNVIPGPRLLAGPPGPEPLTQLV
jgi:hypothetical protein